jgi:hypothetical protein
LTEFAFSDEYLLALQGVTIPETPMKMEAQILLILRERHTLTLAKTAPVLEKSPSAVALLYANGGYYANRNCLS